MPRVFSYGSLRQLDVQLRTFGRALEGIPDTLAGFESVPVWHGNRQLANLVRSAGAAARVDGMAFEISDAELAVADAYEAADEYARIAVVLASGRPAWVYVDAGGVRGK